MNANFCIQEGCCLDGDEYEQLTKLAPMALTKWKEQVSKNKRSTVLRHRLGQSSNWHLLIGE